MLTIYEISEALKDRRIPVVAKAIGVHHNTVSAIRDGRVKSPSHRVVVALSDYLERGNAHQQE